MMRFSYGRKVDAKALPREVTNFDAFRDFVTAHRSDVEFDGSENKEQYDQKKGLLPWVASFMEGGRHPENVKDRPFLWFDVDGCCDFALGILKRLMNECVEGIMWQTPGDHHPLKGSAFPHRWRIVLATTRAIPVHEIEPLQLAVEAHILDEMRSRDEMGVGFQINFDRSVYYPQQIIYLPDANAEIIQLHGEAIDPDDYAEQVAAAPWESTEAWDVIEQADTREDMIQNAAEILSECERVMFDPAFLQLGIDRSDWLRQIARLAAFKDTPFEGDAYSLAARWSKASCPDKFNMADFQIRWHQMGDRTTPFAIFKEARAIGIDAPTKFAEATDDEAMFDEVVQDEMPAVEAFKGWLRFGSEPYQKVDAPKYIIDRLIPQGVTMVVGKSGSFKSYFVLAMACSIAAARPFSDRPLHPGHVVYVAGEGANGISQRINAWHDHYRVTNLTKLLVVPYRIDLFDKEKRNGFVRQLDTLHREEPLRMVVLDTFSALFTGDSDNDSTQVGRFLNIADRIAQRYQCAVVIVHHPSKKGNEARGSGAFVNNTDCVLGVERSDDYLKLSVTKQKYGETAAATMYHVPSSQLPDHYIDRILQETEPYGAGSLENDRSGFTERVFIDTAEEAPQDDEPSERTKMYLSRIQDDGAQLVVCLENAAALMTEQELRDAWFTASKLDRNGGSRRRFKEALKWAIDGNHCSKTDDKYGAVLLF